jgi:3-oxoacyl-[acyl-carrier protein] reductase
MRKNGSGRIINMVSTAAKQPVDNLILSNAVRAAVIGMAKTVANEVAQDNITINNILTGHFLTDRIRQLYNIEDKIQRGISEKEALKELAGDIPMKRLGKPEEFGALVAFLASEQASYITGTSIQIDGGLVRSIL